MKHLIGKLVEAVGTCGIHKDIKIYGILSFEDNEYFVTDKYVSSVNPNTIKEFEIDTNVVVSYQQLNSNDGTSYTQRLRITKDTFNKLKYLIDNEIRLGFKNKETYVYTSLGELYLIPLKLVNNVCFLNLTQTRFINHYLKCDKIKVGRNVCLIIK